MSSADFWPQQNESEEKGISSMLDRISPSMPLGLVAAAAMLLAALIPVPAAAAGEYHVYSCRTPNGEPAPTDGWSPAATGAAGYGDYCAAERPSGEQALIAVLPGREMHTSTDLSTWSFTAPAGTSIKGATVWRAGDADGGANYMFWLAAPNDTWDKADFVDGCVYSVGCSSGVGTTAEPFASENRVPFESSNLGGTHIYASASCSSSCASSTGDTNGYAAVVYIYAADLLLQQIAAPTVSNTMGGLAEQSTLTGSADLRFTAKDEPSGIYQAIVKVDEQVVESPVLDSNSGHCVAHHVDEKGALAFFYVQPCEPTVSAALQLDTTKLTDGQHHIVVEVSDAAGNRTPVIDRQVTVANHTTEGTTGSGTGSSTTGSGSGSTNTTGSGVTGATSTGAVSGLTNPLPGGLTGRPNGSGASEQATLEVRWVGTRKSHITVAFGRSHAINGLLKGPGGPISGAQIEAQAVPAYAGARAVSAGAVRTDSNGRFMMRLSGGSSSRTLRFSYRAHLGDPRPAATGSLTLSVHAGIALRISPRVASAGRRIFFRGTVRGGPIPAGGKQLVLEARSAHSRWLQFHVVRTDARGRFHASYRFRFAGPVRYRFRVVSNYEADFPFLGGASNVVRVFER